MNQPAPKSISTGGHPAGFTLIELLIVVGILGLLSAILLPRVFEVSETAKAEAVAAQLRSPLGQCVTDFYNSNGYYPPDDLRPRDPNAKVAWKSDNGRNTGSESLLAFLAQTLKYQSQLQGVTRVNTDGDQHGTVQKLFDTSDREEFADAWGTPIVYFEKTNMDKGQMVVADPDGDAVKVMPRRRADNVVLGRNSFQLLSAGPDKTFGTADDISWPDN